MPLSRPTTLVALIVLVLGLLALQPATASSPASSKDTARITVTMTLDGKPVTDVGVEVSNKHRTYYAYPTGKKATYSVKVRPGTYHVAAIDYNAELDLYTGYPTKAIRKQDSAPVTVAKGEHRKVTLKLVRAATVTGRVVEASGAPVPNFRLRATNVDRAGRHADVRTDSEGRYRTYQLAEGTVVVKPRKDARWMGEFDRFGQVTVTAKRGRTVTAPDIILGSEPTGTLTARVDAPYLPSDQVVAHERETGETASLVYDATTDLWSQTVSAGTWEVVPAQTGVTSRAVEVTAGSTAHAGTLKIPDATGTLHLTVLTAKGIRDRRSPITILTAAGDSLDVSRVRRDGSVVVPNLVPGTYRVYSRDIAYARGKSAGPLKVKVKPDIVTKVRYRLPRTRSVEGKVVHKGRPVPGVNVRLPGSYESVRTDKKGRFRITGVTAGKVDLELADRSPRFPIQSMTVNLKKRNAKGVVFSITR